MGPTRPSAFLMYPHITPCECISAKSSWFVEEELHRLLKFVIIDYVDWETISDWDWGKNSSYEDFLTRI